jgi:hypothetical protein
MVLFCSSITAANPEVRKVCTAGVNIVVFDGGDGETSLPTGVQWKSQHGKVKIKTIFPIELI